jgi:hypothetical protein
VQLAALVAALALAALTGVGDGSSLPPPSIATCDTVIDHTKFPYATSGYRLVLGVVSVPPAHLPDVYPTHRRPWPYFRKAGLVVRADRGPVVVSVAKAWRTRVAISWGGAGGSVLRIAHCSTKYELRDTDANGAPKMGNAYAGGFRLRSRSACVPLIFRVGKQSETVRFGLGRRCPAR